MARLLRRVSLGLAAGLLIAVVSAPAVADCKLYWVLPGGFESPPGSIQRANLNGSDVEHLLTFSSVEGIALHQPSATMYFTEDFEEGIWRADLDGSNSAFLIDPQTEILGFDVDRVAGKIYWIEQFGPDILTANLDGTDIQRVLLPEPLPNGLGLELHVEDDRVYWGEFSRIRRARLDGSDVQTIYEDAPFAPTGIAIDGATGRIFWNDGLTDGQIQRANLDGSNVETILTGLDRVSDLAIDSLNGKLYWSQFGVIARANLDGSSIENIAFHSSLLRGIALDLTPDSGDACPLEPADPDDPPDVVVPASSLLSAAVLALLLLSLAARLVRR
jgi:sugar lactone lactonase YvrE